jgi:anti-anti-sigma regulatory factor
VRLHIERSVVGPSIHVAIGGILDWSTLPRFRRELDELVAVPYPSVLLDLSGLISWSSQAQLALVRAMARARLNGGELAVSELNPIPSWEAEGSMVPDRLPEARAVYRYRQARETSKLRHGASMSVGLRLIGQAEGAGEPSQGRPTGSAVCAVLPLDRARRARLRRA